jgi:DnaJ family protein C protein 3
MNLPRQGDLSKDAVQQKMQKINSAYEVLNSEELRARYDAGDDPNDPQSGQQGGGGFPGVIQP